MRNWTIVLLAFLIFSFQSTNDFPDFSSPRTLVETFIRAATDTNKRILSVCFSDQSPGEWDDIRNKAISRKDLKEIKDFVDGAVITEVEMQNADHAIVFVMFDSRKEEIDVIKKSGRWFILDF